MGGEENGRRNACSGWLITAPTVSEEVQAKTDILIPSGSAKRNHLPLVTKGRLYSYGQEVIGGVQ